jgi:hypothetical protein
LYINTKAEPPGPDWPPGKPLSRRVRPLEIPHSSGHIRLHNLNIYHASPRHPSTLRSRPFRAQGSDRLGDRRFKGYVESGILLIPGIGASIAIALAQAGARVVLAQRDVSNTDTQDAIRKLGGQADIIPCDLSIREDAAKVVDRALAIVDHIDILVNNGGMLQRADTVDVKDDDWDYVGIRKAVCADLHSRS